MVTGRHFKTALIAALIFAASAYPGQAQPVPQVRAGNAVPVTADNFNRAETDMYFSKRVKKGGRIGNLSHSRELYLTDSPVVRPNRDTLYSGAVFDYDAGPVTITLPDAGNRFMSMQVIDEDQYTHAVYYGAGRYTMTREEMPAFLHGLHRVRYSQPVPPGKAACQRSALLPERNSRRVSPACGLGL